MAEMRRLFEVLLFVVPSRQLAPLGRCSLATVKAALIFQKVPLRLLTS